jgi:hypothetical protein
MNAIPLHFGDEPYPGQNYPLLYNTVYCSRASQGVDRTVIDQIIENAQRCNPENGITGLLVFGSGIFFQWLEGPRDNIIQLMASIEKDSRHQSIVHLSSGEEVRERLFPDWAMELVSADDVRDVLLDARENANDESNQTALDQLLAELDTGRLSDLGQH